MEINKDKNNLLPIATNSAEIVVKDGDGFTSSTINVEPLDRGFELR